MLHHILAARLIFAPLFNPSIVAHPERIHPNGAPCILGLRTAGEDHISSLIFRSSVITGSGALPLEAAIRLASSPRIANRTQRAHGDEVELVFDSAEDISERVIFPVAESQASGIEDACFVLFEAEGERIYFATYTCFAWIGIEALLAAMNR
jgi:hypothetical protein